MAISELLLPLLPCLEKTGIQAHANLLSLKLPPSPYKYDLLSEKIDSTQTRTPEAVEGLKKLFTKVETPSRPFERVSPRGYNSIFSRICLRFCLRHLCSLHFFRLLCSLYQQDETGIQGIKGEWG
jgi:hypothetical protein